MRNGFNGLAAKVQTTLKDDLIVRPRHHLSGTQWLPGQTAGARGQTAQPFCFVNVHPAPEPVAQVLAVATGRTIARTCAFSCSNGIVKVPRPDRLIITDVRFVTLLRSASVTVCHASWMILLISSRALSVSCPWRIVLSVSGFISNTIARRRTGRLPYPA